MLLLSVLHNVTFHVLSRRKCNGKKSSNRDISLVVVVCVFVWSWYHVGSYRYYDRYVRRWYDVPCGEAVVIGDGDPWSMKPRTVAL